jgi:hypothetical protein
MNFVLNRIKSRPSRFVLAILFLILLTRLEADSVPEVELTREQRIQWWREARFGMFIHWGLYAIPAGVWKDNVHAAGYSEWIMFAEKIPAKEYEKLAEKFNPSKFDAMAWATVAKQAGMKYMVFTTKHLSAAQPQPNDHGKINAFVPSLALPRAALKRATSSPTGEARLGSMPEQLQDNSLEPSPKINSVPVPAGEGKRNPGPRCSPLSPISLHPAWSSMITAQFMQLRRKSGPAVVVATTT